MLHNCGWPHIHDPDDLQGGLCLVPFSVKATIHDAAEALSISDSAFYSSFVEQELAFCHGNHQKPHLSKAKKESCLNWVLQFIHINVDGTMLLMYDMVHIDEKWFDPTNKVNNYYFTPNKTPTNRSITNGNRLSKLMFSTTVSHLEVWPNYGLHVQWKNWLLGICNVQSGKMKFQVSSKGHFFAKSVSVTRKLSCTFFIEKVILEIKNKWSCSF